MRIYRLLHNAKINAGAKDVEAFISQFFRQPKYSVTVRRDRLNEPEFTLLFRFSDMGKHWGYAKIKDRDDGKTTVDQMFLYDDYFNEEDPKFLEIFYTQFEWLEELSDAIREVFDVEEEKGFTQSEIVNRLYYLRQEDKMMFNEPLKPERPKQKRGAQFKTEYSLRRLREIRLDAIKNNHSIPTKAAAMDEVGITDKTWKNYDLELWTRWDDKSYEQEKRE